MGQLEGRKVKIKILLALLVHKFLRTEYTIAALKKRPKCDYELAKQALGANGRFCVKERYFVDANRYCGLLYGILIAKFSY